jgi:hypothetical protein
MYWASRGALSCLHAALLDCFFPGFVGYCLLKGVAKGLKDVDIQQMLEELADD